MSTNEYELRRRRTQETSGSNIDYYKEIDSDDDKRSISDLEKSSDPEEESPLRSDVFDVNKLKAIITFANVENDTDTDLMKRACSDILEYLKTIKTNVVSSKTIRRDLIEKLDRAIGQARERKCDDGLVTTYRQIEIDLRNIKLGHKVLSSDLFDIMVATMNDISYGAISIVRSQDLVIRDLLARMQSMQSDVREIKTHLKNSNDDTKTGEPGPGGRFF